MPIWDQTITLQMVYPIVTRNTYFEILDLTKRHGKPTTGLLLTLKHKIKANAMFVLTTLGGGACGHLGLILGTVQYANIPGTALYAKPPHPGPLNMALQLFREVVLVENASEQQTVAAIDPKYLKAVCSSITQQINNSINDIFTYLFDG
eukprot:13333925-Ditylum_brightwellii.AAC.1